MTRKNNLFTIVAHREISHSFIDTWKTWSGNRRQYIEGDPGQKTNQKPETASGMTVLSKNVKFSLQCIKFKKLMNNNNIVKNCMMTLNGQMPTMVRRRSRTMLLEIL